MIDKRHLTIAHIKYLLAMRELDENDSGVRCVDIADALNVKKPSVHMMLNTLRNMRLIHKDHYGVAFFTEEGRILAARYNCYYESAYHCLSALFSHEPDIRAASFALLAEVSPDGLEELSSMTHPAFI